MNFIACEGNWTVTNGVPACDGSLVSFTGIEMREELQLNPALTIEEADHLLWATVGLFVTVFGFLILKKVL